MNNLLMQMLPLLLVALIVVSLEHCCLADDDHQDVEEGLNPVNIAGRYVI